MKNTYVIATNVVSPLGFSTEDNFEHIQAQKSGLSFQEFDFTNELFCVSKMQESIVNQRFKVFGDFKDEYSKLEKMCILSVADALKQTTYNCLGKDSVLIFCSTKGNIDLLENIVQNQRFDVGLLLAETAHKIAEFLGFENKPIVVSNACVSGTQGILVGKRFIDAGIYNNVVVLGGDLVTKFTVSGFKAFNALSAEPCQPFDDNRKGVNLGEGAATVILSNKSNEDKDQIIVKAGFSSNDATHISAPSRTGQGLLKAIQKISEVSDLEDIDFVSAHGTATRYNDDMESQALARADLNFVPIHSLKGYFGHTLGAAGVLESVMGIASLQHNQTIISKGFEVSGTVQNLNPIKSVENKPLRSFLKTSSGFGGCNAAVLFSKINL
ncbi:beta-ketoacyl synthase N-terminal-like domain-containing protein [Arcicella sp. LKC2W]|uniref:beta-ketoacyl synthase N-terminal-like domain-containing protein n=1 Tax=Arcicella sp. LKC2W TaxID=2984198 RepID=UPI002B1ED183|nr:beta-ketoacyl synthase N-terminal-like domain-containing protein [Arcicella sp. LKC2W]MEA5460846.1 beta-ketoacyl synthase N-terminal-like domain-containing protein [Arcicella sp. LKC2W]